MTKRIRYIWLIVIIGICFPLAFRAWHQQVEDVDEHALVLVLPFFIVLLLIYVPLAVRTVGAYFRRNHEVERHLISKRFWDRLSSAIFLIACAAVIAVIGLAFCLPHLAFYWHETPAPLSPWQDSLLRVGKFAQNVWLATTTFGVFLVSLMWRLIAARRLRRSAQL